jgi:drug/metabolite transporter (DMT)-like permease
MRAILWRNHSAKYAIAGLASALLFGAATPASKALLHDIQVQTLAGLLYLGGALGVLPAVVRGGSLPKPWRAGRRTGLLLSGAIASGGILGPLMILLGLRAGSAGSVSLWLNLEFVATVLLGHFLFREHLTSRGWVAAGGTLTAALLLAGVEGTGGWISISLIACGCLCWGVDNHLTALIDGIPPAQATFWKGLVAGTFNLALGRVIADGGVQAVWTLSAMTVGALSYGVSIWLYITAAQGMGATRSQMVFSTAPFFGLLLSVTILGEAITGAQILAAMFMVVSLVILFSERHAHAHRHVAMSHQHPHDHDEYHHHHRHENGMSASHHNHEHQHTPGEHTHAHWPDLHHRHHHRDDDV